MAEDTAFPQHADAGDALARGRRRGAAARAVSNGNANTFASFVVAKTDQGFMRRRR
jgi:hypothetical protein